MTVETSPIAPVAADYAMRAELPEIAELWSFRQRRRGVRFLVVLCQQSIDFARIETRQREVEIGLGQIDAVIVAKLDRLTRSVKDLCGLLELFERRKVSLISVAESLDTGSAAGRLVITITGAVSRWEREAIGERTRDAQLREQWKTITPGDSLELEMG